MQSEHAFKMLQPLVVGGVLILAYIAEHLFPQRPDLTDYRHDARNVLVGLLNVALIFGIGFFFQIFMSWYNGQSYGLLNRVSLHFPIRITVEIVVLDFLMYWWHRANHRWALLWRFHRFHHEDRKLNSTSALRFHATELSLSYMWRVLLFPVLGICVEGFAIYGIIFSAVVIFHHSGIRMNSQLDERLRKGVVTPLMHRIHHSVIRREANSNYGSVLPWWDWLFGSYTAKPEAEISFGVD